MGVARKWKTEDRSIARARGPGGLECGESKWRRRIGVSAAEWSSSGGGGWGVSSFRRGHAGDSRLMPFKAFAVASLFVGSAASASVAGLQASGIHKVEDLMEVGANIRTGLGIPPRIQEGKTDDL
ncbi:hypothetical protein Tsubulata_002764 [Turnera subulata]|uniref:Uncharacterized protein n=1 Tax=Turnera subulata TaxID=218843 RepID=A0A9Q0JLY6_9ROSI|nr:hypothetical protein Tsubulata_002764 [Turnera subulata]